MAEDMRIDVFLPTYYTSPPCVGLKSVLVAYDLIDYEFPLFAPNGAGFVERQRKLLLEAGRVVAISNETKRLLSQAFGVDGERLSVAHLATSDAFVPQPAAVQAAFRAKYTRDLPFFLFVGSVDQYKNVGVLFRSFAQTKARNGHVLVLAGHSVDAIDTYFQQLALELGIERLVIRLPKLDDQELAAAYSASTAFIFPSVQEGFGIPLLEAMRCQTTVIASDIPVFREVAGDEVVYFPTHDAAVLAERMDEAAGNPRARTSSRVERYSWGQTARVLYDACMAVAAEA